MIGIITKILGKSKSEAQVIEEIHNEFDTAPDRLLQQALTIINENKNGIVSLESELINKANRLEKLGFVKNGLVAKKHGIVKRNNDKEQVIQLELTQANQIEYYSREYPFLKFLPESELDRICDKYGLIYAPVNNYKMPVPNKNLAEIEDAQPLKSTDSSVDKYMLRLPYSQQWEYNMPSDLKRILNDGFYIPKDEISYSTMGDAKTLALAKHYGNYNGSYNHHIARVHARAEIIEENRSGLFIAAPKKHFDLKGLKFDKKKGYFTFTKTLVKSDPIVFRYVKGGIQVLSKWGLEANDPALQVEILN